MDEADIHDLAGTAAFERGQGYAQAGRVTLTHRSTTGFKAEARGERRYRLWLEAIDKGRWHWDCSCPAAEDGGFCKHLVAGALQWQGVAAPTSGQTESEADDLHAMLMRQPVERLADWLIGAAEHDPGLDRRLRLYAAIDGPEAVFKRLLARTLDKRGFIDYHDSLAYAYQLEAPIDALAARIDNDPDSGLRLADYAVRRLIKLIERSDDSAGVLGDAMARVAELHADAAARASVSGSTLARQLYALKQLDDWDLFPLADYWSALGDGQSAYGRRVIQAYEALPESPADIHDTERGYAEWPVVDQREELARVSGDFQALKAVLQRGMRSGYDYQRLIEACREFEHFAEALAWAERGLKAFPDWHGMRETAATELARAGFDNEARELLFEAAVSGSDESAWRELRELSGPRWPETRAALLAERHDRREASGATKPLADACIRLLWADGDLAAATQRAAAEPTTARDFIQRAIEARLPDAEAGDYAGLVHWIAYATAIAPDARTREWVETIRERYSRRRKLMTLLRNAGLIQPD